MQRGKLWTLRMLIRNGFMTMLLRRKILIALIIIGLLCIAKLNPLYVSQAYLYVRSIGKEIGEVENKWLQQRKFLLESSNKTKLFLFSYMRGGSSVAGELFNCDPSATMWYEPGDAFFAYYFGLHHENLPQNDLYFSNFTRRKMDEKELLQHTEFYTNKFNCRYDRLPPQAMSHYFLSESTAMDAYMACRSRHDKGFTSRINKCADHLKQICSRSMVQTALENNCPYYIATTSSFIEEEDSKNKTALMKKWLDRLKENKPNVSLTQAERTALGSFIDYGLCVEAMKTAGKKCLDVAISKCKKDALIVVQVNRAKMEDLEALIQKNPDLYVIHYVRDPRAIAVSRQRVGSLLWHRNERQSIGEAKFLCQRMREDLIHRRRLEMKFPGVFTQIRYEDLVTRPQVTAKKIYSMFGGVPPKSWRKFVAKHMHASKDGGHFGVSVNNATETALKWRKQIPANQSTEINRICADVIQILGYRP